MDVLNCLRNFRGNILSSHPGLLKRNLFGILNAIFNRVSESRIKEVGPDRACAEWLMRNGAHVRWHGEKHFVEHYNSLPLDPEDKGSYQIKDVDADFASISHYGFPHFRGCKQVETVRLHKCFYVDDSCLEQLTVLAPSLHCLEVTRCAEVTDAGLAYIKQLSGLRWLTVAQLDGVKQVDRCLADIKAALPDCNIQEACPTTADKAN